MKNKQKYAFLVFFFLMTTSFYIYKSKASVTSAFEYIVADGTKIELSVTIDVDKLKYEYNTQTGVYSVFLDDGLYPFIVKVKLITLGSSYVALDDIRVDYRLGNTQEYYIEYDTQLTTPSTSQSRTKNIRYQKDWGTEIFEMKVTATLVTGLENDVGSSNWDTFLRLEPKGNGLIFVYIFVPIGAVAIAGGISTFFVIRKRKNK
ncbi:MAG: hypothetical protein ACTSP3_08770 [Candidatus Heimdallarchaeaceae archaeon]